MDDEQPFIVVHEEPQDLCTWTDDPDERRRAFVLIQFADYDLDEVDRICKWLKDGTLPHKLKLHTVKE